MGTNRPLTELLAVVPIPAFALVIFCLFWEFIFGSVNQVPEMSFSAD